MVSSGVGYLKETAVWSTTIFEKGDRLFAIVDIVAVPERVFGLTLNLLEDVSCSHYLHVQDTNYSGSRLESKRVWMCAFACSNRFEGGCPFSASALKASKSMVDTASVSSVAGDADPRFGDGMISGNHQ